MFKIEALTGTIKYLTNYIILTTLSIKERVYVLYVLC